MLFGKAIPVRPLEMLAPLALKKLGVWVGPGSATRNYNERRTTQLPAGVLIDTWSRRISRKIGFGGCFVEYENQRAKMIEAGYVLEKIDAAGGLSTWQGAIMSDKKRVIKDQQSGHKGYQPALGKVLGAHQPTTSEEKPASPQTVLKKP